MIADLEDATAASMAQLEQMKDEHEHDRAALEEEVARLRTQLEEEGARAREFAETCQTLAAAVEDSEKVSAIACDMWRCFLAPAGLTPSR